MITRSCLYCEIEFGIKRKVGDRVSHGICKRHQITAYLDLELPDMAANVPSKPETGYCADLSQGFDG